MAKFINQNIVVKVNSVDLSDHAFSVDTPAEREQVDVSGFNSTGAKEFLPGSTDETVTIGFLQDYAASSVHATLEPLYRNSSTFLLQIWPSGSVTSSTNPVFQGTAAMFSYNGLAGDLGSRSEISAVFKSADALAPLQWATA
jgi:hypothetical protein